jgi:5,10-methylenetetrahydromethanopterin reductase
VTRPRVGAVFAPVADTPEHIALAERLGFSCAWVYDSPLLYRDPFVTLGLAAERTRRIGLGVGVLVPRLRTPVATAAAVRTLSALAPGRVRLAYGAGFTGRFTLGLRPVPLAALEREVTDLRALLRGEEAPHPEGGAAVRPIPVRGAEADAGEVPILVSCRGPGAQALARRIGNGAMTGIFYPGGLGLVRRGVGPDGPLVAHAVAAVADEGEPLDSPRLRAAVGPVVAVAFHAFAEQPWRLEGLDPALRARAERYLERIVAALPAGRRHQELHRGNLVDVVHEADGEVITADTIARFGFCGTAAELRERAEGLAREGVTELALQPGGDVPSELRRLASALIG